MSAFYKGVFIVFIALLGLVLYSPLKTLINIDTTGFSYLLAAVVAGLPLAFLGFVIYGIMKQSKGE